MKNLARIRWVLFSVAMGCGAGGAMLAACASDDIIVHPPKDSGSDATLDSGKDTGTDAQTDAQSDADAGPVDGGPDSTTNFDAGFPTLERWVEQATELYCQKTAFCCGESNFDYAKCKRIFMTKPNPGAVQNNPAQPFLDGGKMKLDIAAATKCYEDINKLSCGATAGALRKTYDDCVAGAVGTIPVGQSGCKGSPECVPPAHCELADGGLPNGTTLGTCVAPRTTNALCDYGQYDQEGNLRPNSANLYYEPQAQCGNMLSGNPGYCANADTYYGWDLDGGRVCQPPAGQDAGCYVHQECSTSYCDGVSVDDAGYVINGHCSNDPLVGAIEFCDILRVRDAGTGDASPPFRSESSSFKRSATQEELNQPGLRKRPHGDQAR
ncbi:hypothetical protein LVJ94_13080 [Pendulispora rubella]|uniref:Uncharacterized protein n=1 Tax=Pendulispora rubella TaxID=2741070 RepID=A0ABZ2LB83_9BACT